MQKLTAGTMILLPWLLLCACTAGTGDNQSALLHQEPPVADSSDKSGSLRLLPGCMAEDTHNTQLSVEWTAGPDGMVAEISAANLSNAKAIYISLPVVDIPASRIEVTGTDWAGEDALSLAVPVSVEELHLGIAMLHPQDKPGFTGNTRLATLRINSTQPDSPPTRVTSSAPVSQASQIDLNYSAFLNSFSWLYRNQGDYDQNGEVNIADLTPVAIHFGKSGGPFDEETIESVVDGDGNGEINIADISPIGMGFGSMQNNFNIYSSTIDKYPASPTEPSSFPMLQIVPFGEYDGVPSEERLRFSVSSDGPPNPNPAYWLRPAIDGSEGIPSTIAGLGNLPPVLNLNVSQRNGIAPHSVTFDASGSTDPEGQPLRYFWTFFELGADPEEEAEEGGPIHMLEELGVGTYGMMIFLMDHDGEIDIDMVLINVFASAGWNTWEVDAEIDGHEVAKVLDIDLAIIPITGFAGKGIGAHSWIGVCYQTPSGSGRFGVVQGIGLTGESLQDAAYITSDANIVSGEIELLPDDNAVQVFSLLNQQTQSELRHSYTSGGSIPDVHVVSAYGTKKKDLSVAVLGDSFGAAYHDETNGTLDFVLSYSDYGSSWSSIATLDDVGDTGEQANLVELNGAPAVAYYAPGGLRVRYIDSTMNNYTVSWNSPTTVKALPGAILSNGFAVLPGDYPWLMVHDTVAAEFVSMAGANLGTETMFANTTGNVQDLFSTAVINNRVCAAWYARDAQELRFLRSTDAFGTVWEPFQVIDTGLLVGAVSLADADGFPAMAWFDGLQQTVHYGILVE